MTYFVQGVVVGIVEVCIVFLFGFLASNSSSVHQVFDDLVVLPTVGELLERSSKQTRGRSSDRSRRTGV